MTKKASIYFIKLLNYYYKFINILFKLKIFISFIYINLKNIKNIEYDFQRRNKLQYK